MMIALLLLFYFAVPLVLQRAATRYLWIEKVGIVTLCYIAGVIVGNLPGAKVPETEAELISGTAIALAIPLLLFSSDFGVWRRMGKKLVLSFACCIVAVTISVTVGTCLFKDAVPEAWKVGSMLMGVYTGGTPNLSMIGTGLGVNQEAFVIINGAEMMFGGIWLLFLLSAAKPFFRRLMKSTPVGSNAVKFSLDEAMYWKSSPLAGLIAVVILAAGFGLSTVFPNEHAQLVALLTVTSLGLGLSLVPRIRRLKGSYGLGNFLLLVFCVVIGSLADVHKVLGAAPSILGFVAFVMGLTIFIHALLSVILRIDADTFIIASTAGIYGPPFIAPVAKAIKSPQLISVGIALGLLGLAIGNYLGITISQALQLL